MATSIEVRKSRESFRTGVFIAWEYVPYYVLQELVVILNPQLTISGNDWRMLASRLQFTLKEIMYIESVKDTNTHVLFKWYGQRQNASLNEVYNCLEEMNREDCLEIIDNAYEDIYKMATEKRHDSPNYQPDGSGGMFAGHYSSSRSELLHYNSMQMSLSHCSCYHSATLLTNHKLTQFSHERIHTCLLDNNRPFPYLPFPQHSPSHDGAPEISKFCSKGEQSLALLKSMVDCPDKYRPTPEYKHVVVEQKIDTEAKKKNEKVFIDVKPAEYQKVSKKTKVFVTYSNDNKSHERQVLSLCTFLKTNGFACYVDFTKKSDAKSDDHIIEWCSKKMSEAAFILVCVSLKYLQDINSGSMQNGKMYNANERQIHTKEIFGLMKNRYIQSSDYSTVRQAQIVPVLFGGMQAVGLPQWMVANRPVYMWPDHYQDLLNFLLTKQQERIKVSRHCMDKSG